MLYQKKMLVKETLNNFRRKFRMTLIYKHSLQIKNNFLYLSRNLDAALLS